MKDGAQNSSLTRWAKGDPLGQGHLNEPVDALNAMAQGRPKGSFVSTFPAILTMGPDSDGRYSWVEAIWQQTADSWGSRPAEDGGLWGLCDADTKTIGAKTITGPVFSARAYNVGNTSPMWPAGMSAVSLLPPAQFTTVVTMLRIVDALGDVQFVFSWDRPMVFGAKVTARYTDYETLADETVYSEDPIVAVAAEWWEAGNGGMAPMQGPVTLFLRATHETVPIYPCALTCGDDTPSLGDSVAPAYRKIQKGDIIGWTPADGTDEALNGPAGIFDGYIVPFAGVNGAVPDVLVNPAFIAYITACNGGGCYSLTGPEGQTLTANEANGKDSIALGTYVLVTGRGAGVFKFEYDNGELCICDGPGIVLDVSGNDVKVSVDLAENPGLQFIGDGDLGQLAVLPNNAEAVHTDAEGVGITLLENGGLAFDTNALKVLVDETEGLHLDVDGVGISICVCSGLMFNASNQLDLNLCNCVHVGCGDMLSHTINFNGQVIVTWWYCATTCSLCSTVTDCVGTVCGCSPALTFNEFGILVCATP